MLLPAYMLPSAHSHSVFLLSLFLYSSHSHVRNFNSLIAIKVFFWKWKTNKIFFHHILLKKVSSASCSNSLFHPPIVVFIYVPCCIYYSSYLKLLSFTKIKKKKNLSQAHHWTDGSLLEYLPPFEYSEWNWFGGILGQSMIPKDPLAIIFLNL